MFTKISVKNYHGKNFTQWGKTQEISSFFSYLTQDYKGDVLCQEKGDNFISYKIMLPHQIKPTTIELMHHIENKPF